eukprot:7211016-Prymnesium_polylepis.1
MKAFEQKVDPAPSPPSKQPRSPSRTIGTMASSQPEQLLAALADNDNPQPPPKAVAKPSWSLG